MLYGVPYPTGFNAVSVYDKKPVHSILMCCNAIKWVQKTWQVYDSETKMVHDAHFFFLNLNDSYNHNMSSVDLIDQLRNVYQVVHWIFNYKWWWSLFFWFHGPVLVNTYIVYKTLCEEGKVNPTRNYKFWRLFLLAKTDPKNFGRRDHLVLAVQFQGIIKSVGLLLLLFFHQRSKYKRNIKMLIGSLTWRSPSYPE